MAGERPLDEKDHEIITMLQENAWITHTKIGEAVHLSPSAVQRRIESLRARGVITGAKATIDPKMLRRRLRIYLLMELHDDSRPALNNLVQELSTMPEVAYIDLVTGKFDLIAALDMEDMESFSEFAMNSLNQNANIKHCWTLTRLKKLI